MLKTVNNDYFSITGKTGDALKAEISQRAKDLKMSIRRQLHYFT